MGQPFSDSTTAQQDAAATRHAQAYDWRTSKPTKSAGIHPLIADILSAHGMPQGDALQTALDKASPRRFTGEPQTGFGAL